MKRIKMIFILVFCILISSCNKNNANIIGENSVNYTNKASFTEKGDGWIYTIDIEKVNGSDTAYYYFNGINLKYKELPDYYIEIIDGETSEIIDKIKPNTVTLVHNKDAKDEVLGITDFLNEKQFNDIIDEDDLADLELSFVSKEDIITLFNAAIIQEDMEYGKYHSYPDFRVIQEDEYEEYQWQVGYILNYGHIEYVNIELLYDGTTYLSDIYEDDSSLSSLYNFIEDIERSIINNQEFSLKGIDTSHFKDINFDRLANLLEQFENYSEQE